MKRKVYVSALCGALFLTTFNSQSQVTIGSDDLPASYSVLELKSNYDGADAYGGLRLPQMTTEQRNKLNLSPANKEHAAGLAIYNTTTGCIDYWDGTEWINICKDNDLHCDGVYDAEGNFYTARRFGEAGCWMTQNLRSKKDSRNNAIHFYYPNSDQTILNDHPEYGLLYPWAAAINGNAASDTIPGTASAGSEGKVNSTLQGICPKGWVLPSDKDWSDLEKEVTQYPTRYSTKSVTYPWKEAWRYTIGARPEIQAPTAHGYAMMSAKASPSVGLTGGESKISPDGFDVILTGYFVDGGPALYGKTAILWTGTAIEGNAGEAFCRAMSLEQEQRGAVERYAENSSWGASVRCKKLELK